MLTTILPQLILICIEIYLSHIILLMILNYKNQNTHIRSAIEERTHADGIHVVNAWKFFFFYFVLFFSRMAISQPPIWENVFHLQLFSLLFSCKNPIYENPLFSNLAHVSGKISVFSQFDCILENTREEINFFKWKNGTMAVWLPK